MRFFGPTRHNAGAMPPRRARIRKRAGAHNLATIARVEGFVELAGLSVKSMTAAFKGTTQ